MPGIFKNTDPNRQLSTQGFAVVPFADAETLQELRSFYNALQPTDAKGTYVTMFNPSVEYRTAIDMKIKELCGGKATQLMDGYRVLYTNFMVKQPGPEGDFPVHQDWTYVDESKYSSVAFWIPMQDVDAGNGALHVVPGSHKFVTALRGPYVNEPFGELSSVIKSDFSQPVKLKAGEALVWDHRLIHFSLPNLSPAPRMAFTLIMVPQDAQALHCYSIPGSGGTVVEKYAVDADFYMRYTIGQAPLGVSLIDRTEQPATKFNEQQLQALYNEANAGNSPAQNMEYKKQSEAVAAYYDEYQQGYNDTYGDMIQAFRPADTNALMQYLCSSAALQNGQKVLDAGCGTGGPAVWIAKQYSGINIAGVTISDVQVAQANERIAANQLQDRVKISKGDFHELSATFNSQSFDVVLFLESLGHAGQPAQVIKQAYEVLKPGGHIYIKDFYYKQPEDAYWKQRVEKVIDNINRLYSYNVLNLTDTIIAARAAGFDIEFIRKFGFDDDIAIRVAFESRFGIDIFGGEQEFYPAEWLEIKFIKPLQ